MKNNIHIRIGGYNYEGKYEYGSRNNYSQL